MGLYRDGMRREISWIYIYIYIYLVDMIGRRPTRD
jgi:hypothetical protein